MPARRGAAKGARRSGEKLERGKVPLTGAKVYLHLVDDGTGSHAVHLDVEHPDLARIVQPREACFAGGSERGVFIGLTPPMLERAEAFLKRLGERGATK